MNEREKNAIKIIKNILQTERQAVGIKFLKTKEEYDLEDAIEPVKKFAYCVAVQSATKGHSIKLNCETSGCSGSTRALGLTAPISEYYTGESGYRLGLYKDIELAKNVANNFKIFHKTSNYGVLIKPLEKFDIAPDVVIIIAEPYSIMRVIQGYSYDFGIDNSYNMSGNQGICIECTSYPFIENTLNISFLCSGTRHHAHWSKTEAGVGMPFSVFLKVVDGLCNTLNSVENDENKKLIINNLKNNSEDYSNIMIGTAYYL